MELKSLERADLNLLVTLQVLLEERSVSKAAERLFLTQSAMSKALGRLRSLFDDRLFTRSGAGMVPTPRALEIAQQLPLVLEQLQQLVQPESFDPANYSGDFSIIIPEFVGYWALPELMVRLNEKAPNYRLKTASHAEHQLELLASGEVDFVIQVEQQVYPAEIDYMTVGFAPPVLIARKDHPLVGKELTWELISHYPQVQLFIPDLIDAQFVAQSDSAFIQYESQVTPRFETEHLFTALQLVKRSDYLLPGPPIFIEELDMSRDIVTLSLPGNESLRLKYVLAFHQRVKNSKPHQFLKSVLIEAVESYRASRGLPVLAEMRRIHNLER
ncbi:MAG: LysR family transcriptional regulator [Cellvibrionaceae bacterium]